MICQILVEPFEEESESLKVTVTGLPVDKISPLFEYLFGVKPCAVHFNENGTVIVTLASKDDLNLCLILSSQFLQVVDNHIFLILHSQML
jgi:hypothetical protein